jgi:hypothetical protein
MRVRTEGSRKFKRTRLSDRWSPHPSRPASHRAFVPTALWIGFVSMLCFSLYFIRASFMSHSKVHNKCSLR